MSPIAAPSLYSTRPAEREHDPYYARYVDQVPDGSIMDAMIGQRDRFEAMFGSLDDARALHRYAPGKWSVKELLGHLSDTERVFAHRAFRFGRGDSTPLPGFDENAYVPAGAFDARSVASLLAEWRSVRAATLALFQGFVPEAWDRSGSANGSGVTVRALGWIIVGHAEHHLQILRERYQLGGA